MSLRGEPTQVTSLPLDVGAFALSPDGTTLVVAWRSSPTATTLECTKQRLEAKEKDKTTGQLYDRLFVRHWDTWATGAARTCSSSPWPAARPSTS